VVASLVVAGVLAAFDPQLVRPERIALLGVLLGAGTRSPRVATLRHAGIVPVVIVPVVIVPVVIVPVVIVPVVIVSVACALALLRLASYAVSSTVGREDGAAGLDRWAERQVLAQRLFPRSSLDERIALAFALRDRCDAADDALQRFLVVHPRYWGARVEVADCFARARRSRMRGDRGARLSRSSRICASWFGGDRGRPAQRCRAPFALIPGSQFTGRLDEVRRRLQRFWHASMDGKLALTA